jgi:hypothetical protein
MRAPMDGTTNVARFFCRQSPMFWCGRNGARPGTLISLGVTTGKNRDSTC